MLCLLLCYGTTCLVQSSLHILWASSPFPLGFVPSSLSIASGSCLCFPPHEVLCGTTPRCPVLPLPTVGKQGWIDAYRKGSLQGGRVGFATAISIDVPTWPHQASKGAFPSLSATSFRAAIHEEDRKTHET